MLKAGTRVRVNPPGERDLGMGTIESRHHRPVEGMPIVYRPTRDGAGQYMVRMDKAGHGVLFVRDGEMTAI